MTNKAMQENIQNASKYNNAANGVASVTLADGRTVHNNGTAFGGYKGVVQAWAKSFVDHKRFEYDRVGFNGRMHKAGELMAPKPYEVIEGVGLVALKRGKFHGCPWGNMNVRIHKKDYTIIVFSAKMDKH